MKNMAARPFTVVPMCIGLDAKTEDVASAILGILVCG